MQYVEGLKVEQYAKNRAEEAGVLHLSIWADKKEKEQENIIVAQDWATKEWVNAQLQAIGISVDIATKTWLKIK